MDDDPRREFLTGLLIASKQAEEDLRKLAYETAPKMRTLWPALRMETKDAILRAYGLGKMEE